MPGACPHCRNLASCLHALKARGGAKPVLGPSDIPLNDPDVLRAMLKDLDTTDRAAVIMRYWYDFSEKEIAESLNLTVSAVKSRLHRSRKELAGMWQEEEEDDLLAEMERRHHESPAF